MNAEVRIQGRDGSLASLGERVLAPEQLGLERPLPPANGARVGPHPTCRDRALTILPLSTFRSPLCPLKRSLLPHADFLKSPTLLIGSGRNADLG